MWHLACVCCKTCRTFGGVQPPRDQSQCECHKITKYHLADFVGGELKNILTDAAGPDWWQLQILNFWVNLQNSNCISYCVAWPPLTGHRTPGLDTGHSVTKLWKHNLSRPLACERAWPNLSQPPPPPSPSDHPFFRHKASLSYFVNVTKRPQRIGRHSFLMKNHISIGKPAILVKF